MAASTPPRKARRRFARNKSGLRIRGAEARLGTGFSSTFLGGNRWREKPPNKARAFEGFAEGEWNWGEEEEEFAAAHSHLQRSGVIGASCADALPLAWLLGDDRLGWVGRRQRGGKKRRRARKRNEAEASRRVALRALSTSFQIEVGFLKWDFKNYL